MSSKNFSLNEHSHFFRWDDKLDISQYFFADYKISSVFSAEESAIGMALEQSTATLYIKNYVTPDDLKDWSIRVFSISTLPTNDKNNQVASYFLPTEAYQGGKRNQINHYLIRLAFPKRLVGSKPAQLMNIVLGELPRLGFINSFQLVDIDLPEEFGCGPAFGVEGIKSLLQLTDGPLLCRSTRPGIGLTTKVMAQLNKDVLTHGFHLVKDDELIFFETNEHFRQHLSAMVTARDEAIAATGEKKLYVANLICEPDELEQRWQLVNELGVDAVLVAPFIQGFSVLLHLAKQKKIPILAHNACGELQTRHPHWGMTDVTIGKIFRKLGADWIVTPGPFGEKYSTDHSNNEGNKFIAAVTSATLGLKPMMPIIQGGKNPQDLPHYIKAINSKDFMMIVASWVDGHPQGLQEGAKIFRAAVDSLS